MAFLDKVTDLSRSALKKSEEVMENTKTTLKISEKKSIMKDYYIEIGKLIYDNYKKGEQQSGQVSELCQKLKEQEAEIKALQEQLNNEE